MLSRLSRLWFIVIVAALMLGGAGVASAKAPRKTATTGKATKAAKAAKKRRAARKRRAAKRRRAARLRRTARLRRAARARRAAKRTKAARTQRVRMPRKTNGPSAVAARVKAARLATPGGSKVLRTAQAMIDEGRIVKGSCWDWAHAVYNRAGFPNKRGTRRTAFKGTKKSGPYAKPSQLQPGDWIYHVNHQYRGVPHSAIFVRWIDRTKRIAETLSYAGSRRNKPGRYGVYDLSNVYRIIRPGK